MHPVAIIAGAIIIILILLDAFESVVLPRRVQRHFRFSAWFYRNTWIPWARIAARIKSPSRRENFLGYFGPLSLLFLFMLWAAGLILGFSLLQFGAGKHVRLGNEPVTFGLLMYHSGETFFTLGYGDVTPATPIARALAVTEAGMGFGFLAVVIGYLPTIYSGFSRREIEISLLDVRAGSPPTAAELLMRFRNSPQGNNLDNVLRSWERWSAEVLESHLSYPVLSFFRSQHNNQSWLGALTTILDASALIIAGIDQIPAEQARMTFAMARHAAVDLAQVVNARYDPHSPDRLGAVELTGLRKLLASNGLNMRDDTKSADKLSYLRSMYEPYVAGIARNLLINLPPWSHPEKRKDNWQSAPWDRLIQARGLGEKTQHSDEHF